MIDVRMAIQVFGDTETWNAGTSGMRSNPDQGGIHQAWCGVMHDDSRWTGLGESSQLGNEEVHAMLKIDVTHLFTPMKIQDMILSGATRAQQKAEMMPEIIRVSKKAKENWFIFPGLTLDSGPNRV